nr:MAG TPA: hypothetical protein [Caudoviricetes sp.]
MNEKFNSRQMITLINLMKRVDSIVSCEAEFTLKGNELDVDALERRLKEAIEDVCSLLRNQEHK